ncbi:MAG: phosphoribosyltransferase family protein [Bacteroidales bacterium]
MASERSICLKCLYLLPRPTSMDDYQVIDNIFRGKVLIDKSSSLFYYSRESKFASIIKNIKYGNQPEIGRELAKQFAAKLITTGFFDSIDYIVPIPLHPLREYKREYNQSEFIAEGISQVTSIPVLLALQTRLISPLHQTRKDLAKRISESKKNKFILKSDIDLSGKHILLVDDVVTTGATLINGVKALRHNDSVIVSILTLATDRLE